ncbi:MAG TPA: spore coat protein [Symbiobacteriaceae bacterium]|jgi:spore coat protein CotF
MPETHDLSTNTRRHMSDADRLHDCLCDAKERAMLYARAAVESTNNGVREFFLAMHGEETHNQEILFSFLHTRGFYPTEMVTGDTIREVRRRYQALHDQMGLTDDPSFRRYQTADPKLPPAHAQEPGSFESKSTGH